MTITPLKPSPDWDMVTLKWAGNYLDGAPATGAIVVTYSVTTPLLDDDGTTPINVFPVSITVPITTTTVLIAGQSRQVGYAEVQVPASNDPDITGGGGTYAFTEQLGRGTGRAGVSFVADKDAPGGVIWLNKVATAIPTPATPLSVVYWSDFTTLRARVDTLEQAGANVPAATTTSKGIVELATNIEAVTGTDTALVVTPAGLKAAFNALLAGAPAALDTLDELAAAIGDDANYAATITTALAGKQPIDSDLTAIAALTTTAYGRGFLTLANTAALMALLSAATTSAQGIVELADATETTTGTDTTRAVTPVNLKVVTDTLARRDMTWKASTAYAVGELAVNGGTLYQRNTAGTSGSTFTASEWTAIASVKTLPSGVLNADLFIFTDPTVTRPSVPTTDALIWAGPAGSGGAAPTNLGPNDIWLVKVS